MTVNRWGHVILARVGDVQYVGALMIDHMIERQLHR
jgi:hypothetical protein